MCCCLECSGVVWSIISDAARRHEACGCTELGGGKCGDLGVSASAVCAQGAPVKRVVKAMATGANAAAGSKVDSNWSVGGACAGRAACLDLAASAPCAACSGADSTGLAHSGPACTVCSGAQHVGEGAALDGMVGIQRVCVVLRTVAQLATVWHLVALRSLVVRCTVALCPVVQQEGLACTVLQHSQRL